MTDRVTFAPFDAALSDLGFQKQVIPSSHVNDRHPHRDAPLMVRLHKPKDLVPGYVLPATRVELKRFGIIAATDFEPMLRTAAA